MNGKVRTEIELPFVPCAFDILSCGDLLVGDARRRILYRLKKSRQEQVADASSITDFFLSDAICAWRGSIYLGGVGYDFRDPLVDPVPKGIIVLIDERGSASLVADGLYFPSAMLVAPNSRTLIVAEALGHRLTAFDIAEGGALRNKRLWAQLPDDVNPAGICMDGDGAIWAAATTARAVRLLEGGEIVDEVIAQRGVTALALGGPEHTHLFLCTSKSADPVITRRYPDATIDKALVKVAGLPAGRTGPAELHAWVQ